MRDFEYIKLYTEEEFEDIQANYVVSKSTSDHDYITKLAVYQKFGVLEYNIVEQSGKIIQYSLVDKKYRISDVFKNHDEYISTAFPDLKINLKDIFE